MRKKGERSEKEKGESFNVRSTEIVINGKELRERNVETR
jgi:hypothetical protein